MSTASRRSSSSRGTAWPSRDIGIGAGDEAVELKVRRVGEPAAGPPLHTLPPVLPREEELALARRLIGTDLTVLTGETTRESYPLVGMLPRVDFDRAWDLVENARWPIRRSRKRCDWGVRMP